MIQDDSCWEIIFKKSLSMPFAFNCHFKSKIMSAGVLSCVWNTINTEWKNWNKNICNGELKIRWDNRVRVIDGLPKAKKSNKSADN